MTATSKPITVAQVKQYVHADSVSRKGDVFTARRVFFYTHGGTSTKFAERIKAELEVGGKFAVEVLDHGEVWKAFNGGASVARSSHWWVTFKVVAKQ